jgi:ribosome-associated toxin RatA of RatAB toxin-antitoxin module
MNKIFRLAICYFYTVCILSITSSGHAWAWDLAKESNNIKVYTRSVEGSSFKEYKGVMQIDATLSSLVALVDDVPAYPKWIHACTKAKVLKGIGQKESFIYTVNDAPWPVSDRDAVTLNVISQNQATSVVTISISGVPDFIPLKPGLVRVERIKGFWQFSPLADGSVEVVYQVHNEPGGNLPTWLVNSVVVTQPFRTLMNMRERIKDSVYNEKYYEFIKEKKSD